MNQVVPENNATMKEKDEFFESYQENARVLGFWDEERTSSVLFAIESRFKHTVLRNWFIKSIVMDGERTLIKWMERFQPLTDKELVDKYGKQGKSK